MAKKVYAYTDTVPATSLDYLTPGKRYEVLDEGDGGLFRAYSDSGNYDAFLWKGCAHLIGGNWTREEVEETP